MTYLIQYRITNDRRRLVAEGKMRVKNAQSEGDAMNKLREHLNKKYWDMHKLQMWPIEEDPAEPRGFRSDFGGGFSEVFNELLGGFKKK